MGTMIKTFQTLLIRRFCGLRGSQIRQRTNRLLSTLINPSKVIFLSHCGSLLKKDNDKMENFDLNLQQACDSGDAAVIEVMDALKDEILSICKAYQDCLKKQMEIIKIASDAGALSSRWDDLPHYRTLASELNAELSIITTILNTIGQMASEGSLIYITGNREQVQLISEKFKEVQQTINKQVEINKKTEAALLDLNKKVIILTK